MSLFIARSPAPQEFIYMDWTTENKGVTSGGTLQDETWVQANGDSGTCYPVVQSKTDNGVNNFSIAVGEGRNGSNALKISTPDPGGGDHDSPAWWVSRYLGSSALSTPADERGYALFGADPDCEGTDDYPNVPYNRMEMVCKMPDGFRAVDSAILPPRYPSWRNHNFGTYHWAKDVLGTGPTVESDGMHYYFDGFVRWDLAEDNWVILTWNTAPTHKRSVNATPVVNPTHKFVDGGINGFFRSLTRMYFSHVTWDEDVEVSYPVEMLCDQIRFYYEPDANPFTTSLDSYDEGEDFGYTVETEHSIGFSVTNTSASSQTARLTRLGRFAAQGYTIEDSVAATVDDLDEIVFTGGETKTFTMEFYVASGTTSSYLVGYGVLPTGEYDYQSGSHCNRNSNEIWFERRGETPGLTQAHEVLGPNDSSVKGSCIWLTPA